MATEKKVTLSGLGDITCHSAQQNGPTAQDWDDHKNTIKNLYLVQKLPLPRVMNFMEKQHEFHATPKMYKSRFKKWKWRKNNNLEDMTTRARQIADAKRHGVDLVEHEDAKEVERYFKRKGVRTIQEALEPRSDTLQSRNRKPRVRRESELSVTCSSSRSNASSRMQGDMAQSAPNSFDQAIAQASVRVWAIDRPATPLEALLKTISVYSTGSCETGVWYTSEDGRFRSRKAINNAASVLDCFVSSWQLGLDLAQRGFIKRSMRTLSKACQVSSQIILAEHPSTIRALLELLLAYSRAGHRQLANHILSSFYRAASEQSHPLAKLSRQLLQIEPEAAEHAALSAMSCAVRTLATQCGSDHYAVVRGTMALMEAEGERNTPATVIKQATHMREVYLSSTKFSREGYFNVAECQVSVLSSMGEFYAAECILEEIRNWAAQFTPDVGRRWSVKCADSLSKVQFPQGKYELAEKNCRYCIETRRDSLADKLSDARSVACATRLSEWLRIWNRGEEAAELEELVVRSSGT